MASPVAALAADLRPGTIVLLESCPGDSFDKTGGGDEAAFLAAALAPLITAVVTQGMKAWGGKLKEAAAEANVDALHTGDHFYEWQKEGFQVRHRCWIVASKSSRSTNRSLSSLVAGYKRREIVLNANSEPASWRWLDGADDLEAVVAAAGFENGALPANLVVLDLELSEQKSEARLVPRFVSLDHSIREWFRPGRPRTVTFEFELTTPGAEKAFGAPSIKLDGLVVGSPRQLGPADLGDPPALTSNWFPLPEADPKSSAAVASAEEAEKQRVLQERAAKVAATAAKAIDGSLLPHYPTNVCLGLQQSEDGWVAAQSDFVVESAKASPSKTELAKHTNLATYYDSCRTLTRTVAKIRKAKPTDGALARSYDITAIIKEFRKRPFAKFLGNVLSDEEVQKGVAGAVVEAIDPVSRAKAAEEAAAANTALLEAYEGARIAAESAIVAHEAAAPTDKAAKYIDMEAKKRTANRRAQDLGIALPYPASGTWLGAGG